MFRYLGSEAMGVLIRRRWWELWFLGSKRAELVEEQAYVFFLSYSS